MWLSSASSFVVPLLSKTHVDADKPDILDSSSATISKTLIPHTPFRLPITYVPREHIRPLSPTIVQDLELVVSPSVSMYENIFQPTHIFGKQMIPEWSQQFTTDMGYLRDTQQIITDIPRLDELVLSDKKCTSPEMCQRLTTIWKDIHHPDFLEKYNFMEWNCLKFLNESSSFLQLLSVGNLMSPVMSLFIPILFLILPFIILKIQGLTLTFEVYIDVLKRLAKNHFIGKAIMSIQSFSPEKILYLFAMLGLYVMQIYQNVVTCRHFYENTRQMNNDLCDLYSFCEYSCKSMDAFVDMHGSKSNYSEFCNEVRQRAQCLRDLRVEIQGISDFSCNVKKMGELGYMLKCYYRIHSREDLRNAIQYAVGFEGYMDNLRGVSRHILAKNISMISLKKSTKKTKKSKQTNRTKFCNQYYPSLLYSTDSDIVKNTISMAKNMIITGPNASGKTTLLKTTAINLIFSQQLGCGYYSEGSMLPKPYTHFHSYLNIPDTSERDSLFQAEARRCKDIIDAVSVADFGHHFCIFDELYSGTNPKEASKAAYAFLKYLSKRKNANFMLTTHYIGVCKKFESSDKTEITGKPEALEALETLEALADDSKKKQNVANFKMNVLLDSNTKRMIYTYCIQPGISNIEGAGKILEDMNYPQEIMGDFLGID